jgi:hypothetical protein
MFSGIEFINGEKEHIMFLKKLLNRPRMYADESLSGFLIRAVQNVYALNYIYADLELFKNSKTLRPVN